MGKKKVGKSVFPTGEPSEQIIEAFRHLGLEACASHFQFFADKTLEEKGTIYDCLVQLLELEYNYREDSRVNRWIQQAKLPHIRPLESFPYDQQPSVDQALVNELASCRYIEKGKNIIFLGGAGVGKTSLALGLAYEAIMKGIETRFMTYNEFDEAIKRAADSSVTRLYRSLMAPQLLIFDDIDYFNTNEESGKFLFDVIKQRFELGLSIIVTSNSAPQDWGNLFGNPKRSGPILDRLLDHSRRVIINIDGASLRVPEAPTPSRAVEAPVTKVPTAREPSLLKRLGVSFSQKSKNAGLVEAAEDS